MEDIQSKNTGFAEELCVVALGKIGAGKSHTGNTILCSPDVLQTNHSSASVTQACTSKTATVNQRTIKYVDTPGLLDSSYTKEQQKSEMLRSIIECAPGPHVFLILLKVERYTEKKIVKKITETFGKKVLNRAVVLFTHGDDLDDGQTITQFVRANSELQKLVDRCGGRCHVIDNKYWNQQEDGYRSNRVQIERLMNTIKEMVRASGGRCYTNKMLQRVQRNLEDEMQKVREESNGRLSEEQIREKAVKRVHGKLVKREVAPRGFLRALLGITDFVGLVAKKIKKKPAARVQIVKKEVVEPAEEVIVAVKESQTENKVVMEQQTVCEPVQQTSQDFTKNKNDFHPWENNPLRVVASCENRKDEPKRAAPVEELRIVALSKTGAGKSHTGNTILSAADGFQTKCSSASVTQECQSVTATVNGRVVKYVDTPGLFDTSDSVDKDLLKSELLRSIIECSPGPHAFLIVLKVERYTGQEQEIVKKFTETFGEEALNYAVVLFTHGDDLEDDQTITQFVRANSQLQKLVDRCGGRCHVIDNKYWNQQENGYRSNRVQIKRLLNTIKKMVRASGGRCYNNEMLQHVQKTFNDEMQEVRVESNGRLSEEQVREETGKRTHGRLLVKLAGVTTGALLGALLGISEPVHLIINMIHGNPEKGLLMHALVAAAKGAQIGHAVAEKEETVLDVIKKTAQAYLEDADVIGLGIQPKAMQLDTRTYKFFDDFSFYKALK